MLAKLLRAATAMVAAKPALARTPQIAMEDFLVPALDPGISIFVRNKRPAGLATFRSERTVLYVHGATYPASTSFDLALDGFSWMDYLAARGYDVYLLDVRGYGRSTRPPEMAETPDNHPPIVRSDTAIRDIGAVVEFILKRRNISRLDLIGWSWGTTTMATYTTQNPDKVERLVLYAPGWVRKTASLVPVAPGPLGAYRMTTRQQALTRWLAGVPEDKKAMLIPAGWFDQWADAAWADDPVGALEDPPVIRAPNGVLADSAEYWSSNRAYYDPARITVPTLLVGAEWDADLPPYMAQTLFPLLVNAPGKRYVLLAEGTHTLLMEKNRLELFKAVQAFLNEAGAS
jgi:pimeloyl-ACP methyl ester carboxylesterase